LNIFSVIKLISIKILWKLTNKEEEEVFDEKKTEGEDKWNKNNL